MPTRAELPQKEQDDNNGASFECSNCKEYINVRYDLMKDLILDGEAIDMFRVYQRRLAQPMFNKKEIKGIVASATTFLRVKKMMYGRSE